MKPPVLGLPPPTPHDPRPALWTTGAILGVSGLGTMLLDNPLVPLTHVFELIPIGLGGAVGAAVLREKYGPRAIAAFVLLIAWLAWQTIAAKTTGGIVFLAAGLFSLVRALLLTFNED